MSDNVLTGEVSNSKLAAVFTSRRAAQDAADALLGTAGLQPVQVKVIAPDATDVAIKLEPEGGGIWRTIVVAHVRLAIVGAVLGVVVFGILMAAGIPMVVQSPWAAGLVLLSFGAVAGLFLGGLVALRPDHDHYVQATRDAMADGNTTVVVHALSAEQQQAAADLLNARGAEVSQTL